MNYKGSICKTLSWQYKSGRAQKFEPGPIFAYSRNSGGLLNFLWTIMRYCAIFQLQKEKPAFAENTDSCKNAGL